MSLILDALKRAERERRAILPEFANPDPSALPQPRRSRAAWLRVLLPLAVAGVAVALAVNYFLREPAKDSAAQLPASSQPVAAAQLPGTVTDEVPATQAPAAPAVIPGTEGMLSLDELAAPDAVAVVPAPATLPPSSSPPAAAQPVIATAEPAPAAAEPDEAPPVEAPPRDLATPPPALTQPAPLRRYREMAPEYRADFPALTIEVHVYQRAVAARWVMVNGRRYKEGERLADGPVLLEIVPEGLVLEYRGERLLYPLSR